MRHHALRSPRALLVLLALAAPLAACSDRESATTESRAPAQLLRARHVKPARVLGAADASFPTSIELFAPEDGDQVGIDGVGWFIDIAIDFENTNLHASGFNGMQLTGPGVHNNAPPFPGVFAPGKDDRLPGLVVLLSTTQFGAKSCQNLANLFNLTGVTNRTEEELELWDTWIITAPNFGRRVPSTLYLAMIKDRNHDGILNDAPDVVPDELRDGVCNERDLQALGLASAVVTSDFFIR
ncbi:MAG TPA: hypothetical protein VFS05_16725 [Gemmatimonadaceae bacterium]|nr:hypothetical protein [Gemmatimonadaceae bacterium]